MPLITLLLLPILSLAYTPKELTDRKATFAHIAERFGYVEANEPPCEGLSVMLEEFRRISVPDSCRGTKKVYQIFE